MAEPRKTGNRTSTAGRTAMDRVMNVAESASWDRTSAFYREGSDERALWDSWYKYQNTGDPSNASRFRQILEKKFPNVASWKQTAPNTGAVTITALNSRGENIAEIDLGGRTVSLSKLQTFMDKCSRARNNG